MPPKEATFAVVPMSEFKDCTYAHCLMRVLGSFLMYCLYREDILEYIGGQHIFM